MKKIYWIIAIFLFIISIHACSKKTTPVKDSVSAPVKKIKTPVPNVIVVNDAAASKTFDGRLYYDLEGHRYWRSNKDGKYYKYSKAMQNDPDFKARP